MEYYLIHMLSPIAAGTKEQCNAALRSITAVGRPSKDPKHFLIISKDKWEKTTGRKHL